jgi:hypothetical protein
MNTRAIVEKLHAYHAGCPSPRGETLRVDPAADEDVLILAFLRMGGESRPWGIVYGHPNQRPTFLCVPEGRNRDQVAEIALKLAPALLRHLRTPGFVAVSPTSVDELAPLRQVWLPNPSHLEMLHHLAFAYMYTSWGDDERPALNALGRACLWLFRESQRPGQQHVVVATEALRAAYTFPSEDVRQGHLGFLLSWLEATGSRDERLAAAMNAERRSMGTSLDPDVERDKLEPLVTRWTEARRSEDVDGMARQAKAIAVELQPELDRRYELAARAIVTLRSDGRRANRGLSELRTAALREQWSQHTEVERGFNGDPDGRMVFVALETDRNPAAAASRYLVHEASADRVTAALLHDDRELLAEAIAAGDAFRGDVIAVRDDGAGTKGRRPVWTIHQTYGGQLRVRIGSHVCVLGLPSREGVVRDIKNAADGGYVFEVEITNKKLAVKGESGMLGVAPADQRWLGEQVTFVPKSAEGIAQRKSFMIWKKDGPGSWLTHARPGGALAKPLDDDHDDARAA